MKILILFLSITFSFAQETEDLCLAFQKKYSGFVQCKSMGVTPEGRTLRYLVVGNRKNPVVWVEAGIHAGEIDGKDAVFWLLKDILQKKISSPLRNLCLVFIPIFRK